MVAYKANISPINVYVMYQITEILIYGYWTVVNSLQGKHWLYNKYMYQEHVSNRFINCDFRVCIPVCTKIVPIQSCGGLGMARKIQQFQQQEVKIRPTDLMHNVWLCRFRFISCFTTH